MTARVLRMADYRRRREGALHRFTACVGSDSWQLAAIDLEIASLDVDAANLRVEWFATPERTPRWTALLKRLLDLSVARRKLEDQRRRVLLGDLPGGKGVNDA
jgi:hypothetical protein